MGKMCQKTLTVLAAILLKCAYCNIYIDLKYNYISEGVKVFYGYLEKMGTYRMYIGEVEGLKVVNFGGRRMFPTQALSKKEFQLIVEVLERGRRRFAILRAYQVENGKVVTSKIFCYELGGDVFIDISMKPLLIELESPVKIIMDIGPKFNHPFIYKRILQSGVNSKIKYTTIKELDGIKLDGEQGPMYVLGPVYDSGKPIVVGHTKMKQFSTRCEAVIVESMLEPNKVIVEYANLAMVFEPRKMLTETVWYLTEKPPFEFLELPIKRAMTTYHRIEENQQLFPSVTVDLYDNITPDLYGIEKTEGYAGHWRYAMYEMNKEFRDKMIIKSVVDTSSEYILVAKVKVESYFTRVEVFRSMEKTVAVITTHVRMGLMIVKDSEVYQKRSNDQFYLRVDEPKRTEMLKELEKTHPIKIRVNLHEKSTAIYDLVHAQGPLLKFGFYTLKPMDDMGEDLHRKFVFSLLMELDPYEKGNVPYPGNIRNYRVVRQGIDARKFVIRNSIEGFPIDPGHYEIYTCFEYESRFSARR